MIGQVSRRQDWYVTEEDEDEGKIIFRMLYF